jgi:ABC-type sulfate transport system permease subunit
MRRIKKSNSLTKQVLQTLIAVGFAMSPVATGWADGTIQKVNGTQYLAPGDKKAEIYC